MEGAGHTFHIGSDAEVLLRMFAIHGPAMLDRLNGIYALAIWDEVERRLFVARDRVGVKPLYYPGTGVGGGPRGGPGGDAPIFAFVSELRCLLPYIGRAPPAHQAYGDIIPAPAAGCPGGSGDDGHGGDR